MTCVLATRIPEADHEEVERRGAVASTPRQAHGAGPLALGGALLAGGVGRRLLRLIGGTLRPLLLRHFAFQEAP